MKSFSTTVATLALAGSAAAFWRMPCRSQTGVARIDPLVAPGSIADHSHIVFGGGNFGQTTNYEDLAQCAEPDYNCTSCGVTEDMSAYWTPPLYFQHEDGTVEMVPNVGGMLAYYLFYLDNLKPFPEGFQMIAGDPTVRNFTGPFPDEQLSFWPTDPTDQFFLQQRAIGVNCLNYGKTPEPSLYRHEFPDKAYMDANCVDGIRLEMAFPSCGTGEKDSPDHKSHVAYPSLVKEGNCPEGYDVHYPFLFYETIFATNQFAGKPGKFVLSTGDPVGTSYHADFIMGWQSADFLGQAIDTCTSPSGQVEDCPIFTLQSDDEAAKCKFAMPEDLDGEDCAGPRADLPMGVPIQHGPEPATKYPVSGAGAAPTYAAKPTKSAKASSAAPTYTSAKSSSSAQSAVVPSAYSSASSKASAAPTTTAAPTVSSSTIDGDVTTKYITKGYEVVEMVIVETDVTVTATASASAAPAYSTPSSSPASAAPAYSAPSSPEAPSYKHKRHMEKHQRRNIQ
ncbi:related to glyoxal oxidase precursor [Ramularia collo-cygni]|uniref:Related to glyoxal oxidase n=1 Tax=Ramularia collo-cygni TaxID=112498 RepID=A0A2D3VKB5_9PEZI|nr:related to glyoxal oxidase precursor [Ramularia collo-cygni]CZT21443.1 related to glyoxal oxidase precursor [Ramularia collo-cygni]